MTAISQEKQIPFAGSDQPAVSLLSEDELLAAIRETLYRPWANAQQLSALCAAAMPFFAGAVTLIHPPEIRAMQTDPAAWYSATSFLNHASADGRKTRFHGASETCWYGWIPSSKDRPEKMNVPEKKFTHYVALGRFLVLQPLRMLTLSRGTGQSRLHQFFALKASDSKLNDNNRKLLRILLLVAQHHFGAKLGIVYPGQSAEFAGTKIVLSEEQLATGCIELGVAQLYRCTRFPDQSKKETAMPCSNEARPDPEGNLIFDRLD